MSGLIEQLQKANISLSLNCSMHDYTILNNLQNVLLNYSRATIFKQNSKRDNLTHRQNIFHYSIAMLAVKYDLEESQKAILLRRIYLQILRDLASSESLSCKSFPD